MNQFDLDTLPITDFTGVAWREDHDPRSYLDDDGVEWELVRLKDKLHRRKLNNWVPLARRVPVNSTPVNVHTLAGEALNWAVAEAQGRNPYVDGGRVYTQRFPKSAKVRAAYTESFEQSGRIITEEGLCVVETEGSERWLAYKPGGARAHGPDHLTAILRCYVIEKLGEVVAIPKELLE